MKVLILQSHDSRAFELAVGMVRSRWPGATIGGLVQDRSLVTRLASPINGALFLYGTSPSGVRPVLDRMTLETLRDEHFDLCVLSFDDRNGIQQWSFRQIPIKAGIPRIIARNTANEVIEQGRIAWMVRTVWACGVLRLVQPRLWVPPSILAFGERYWDHAMLFLLALGAVLAAALKRLGFHHPSAWRKGSLHPLGTLVIFIPYLCLGGAQRALVNFLRFVDRDKYRIHICTLRESDGFFEEEVRALGVQVTYLPCQGGIPFWKIPWALTRFLKKVAPHTVLGWLPWATVFTALAGSLAGVPRIVMCYRTQSPDQRGGKYPAWLRPLDIVSGRLANVVLANSEASRHDYMTWAKIPSNKIVTVYSGVDTQEIRPLAIERIREIRSRLGLGDQPMVGLVGRLTPEKDHETFLQALCHVRESVPAVQAVLVGGGNEEPRLRAVVKELGLADCVRFLGARKDALAIIGSLDVLALTSRTEGLPNVLLEAQAMEVPVVTTDVGGASEVVRNGETGYVVPRGDSLQVAERLMQLLLDKALRRYMGAAGRAYVIARFGADRMAATVLRYCGV